MSADRCVAHGILVDHCAPCFAAAYERTPRGTLPTTADLRAAIPVRAPAVYAVLKWHDARRGGGS